MTVEAVPRISASNLTPLFTFLPTSIKIGSMLIRSFLPTKEIEDIYVKANKIGTIWSMKKLRLRMPHDELPKDVVQVMGSS